MSKVVSTKQQLEKLVALMEENPQFARGICTKVQAATKWEGFALGLNCLGPPTRPAAKWMKVWVDMKSKTKKKLSQNKAEYRATGGGTNRLLGFSNTEESIIGLLEFDACINPPGAEFGLDISGDVEPQLSAPPNPTPHPQAENSEKSEVEFYSEAHELPARKKRPIKKCNKAERLRLLDSQTNAKKQYYEEMVSTLGDIRKCAEEKVEYQKKQYELDKNATEVMLQLKREKLRVYKEEVLKSQQDRGSKLQLKLAILELKKIFK
ncbi:uncharacterized protein LOC126764442 [Bactrocera neohumeralis]|uniref:uncharacterized protein LOC120780895 n=1 Tax=Bactrocera tryoni TaxID=59916 RepID=UPI001A95F97B|nr:uncharacterized protein LOC120780895 [Bactrocera tryoni]XP_050338087.1 uncharacterized protein LOC126764442 [Bactrocera neohumeralis]